MGALKQERSLNSKCRYKWSQIEGNIPWPWSSSPEKATSKFEMKSVLPGVVGIDGHLFHINYDAPEKDTERFNDIMVDESTKYEDIPEDLLQYQVDPETTELLEGMTLIDGHSFKTNYDVLKDMTDILKELSRLDTRYEDVPDELRKYESGYRLLGTVRLYRILDIINLSLARGSKTRLPTQFSERHRNHKLTSNRGMV